jgi:RimJ/RimL family protein N-acetyltransferase
MYAADFLLLLADHAAPGCDVAGKRTHSDGPAFVFPDSLAQSADLVVVQDETLLAHNFGGWALGEIAAGRSPVLAIVEDGRPVSIGFCARSSSVAAEAGVETAPAYRGRGFGPRVVTAWALAVRASGRIPLYSTSWTNDASLSIARKLGLTTYASDWSVYD